MQLQCAGMQPITVLLVDDEAPLRRAYRTIIERGHKFHVIGEANNGAEAITMYPILKPDIVLMDLSMPKVDGVSATAAIVERFPNARILVMTSYVSLDWVVPALRAGAVGYLTKTTSGAKLMHGLEQAMVGEFPVQKDIVDTLVRAITREASADAPALTAREHQVLAQLAEGRSNAQIADLLKLSVGTVKMHVGKLCQKFEVHSRAEIVARAKDFNMVLR